MKKKHSYYWCEDTKDDDMCLTDDEMCKMDTDTEEDMAKPMMHEMMHHKHMHHKNMMLAHSYVPWQCYDKAFSPREALCKGTLFPELYGVYKPPM